MENPTERAWKPLFDGKTKESVLRGEARGWKIDDGKLVRIPEINDAAQTKEVFTDGEVRIRFEVQDVYRMWFNLRQAETPGFAVSIEGDVKPLEGKPHDLVFRAKGDQVTATLDGKPIPVAAAGGSSGVLQFNGFGKRFAVLSIDFRPITP